MNNRADRLIDRIFGKKTPPQSAAPSAEEPKGLPAVSTFRKLYVQRARLRRNRKGL